MATNSAMLIPRHPVKRSPATTFCAQRIKGEIPKYGTAPSGWELRVIGNIDWQFL
jgi:hypothetical protein